MSDRDRPRPDEISLPVDHQLSGELGAMPTG
jgi:hypothetical protein